MKRLLTDVDQSTAKIIGYFDGAAEPVNPGGAMGWGALIERDGECIWEASQMLPASAANSNNVAEYLGLIALLDGLSDQDSYAEPIEIRGDSQLVIKQMFGDWRIGDGLYTDVARTAADKLRRFPNEVGRHVRRHLSEKADELSKRALVVAGIKIAQR